MATKQSRKHSNNLRQETAPQKQKQKQQQQQQQQQQGHHADQQQQQRHEGHPYGVQPWGNFFLKNEPEIRTSGLGVLAPLPDDLVLSLLYCLSADDLARLGLASRALYCFAHTTDLWKALALQELGGDFSWCGTWRETYLSHRQPRYQPGSHKPLQVKGFYSDFLHQPWFCASVDLQQHWLEVDNIDRVADITIEQFRQRYELPNKPVVLSAAAKGWPALEKWDKGYLAAAFAGRPVIVGNMPWRFGAYLSYCERGAELDEMPLYLFDKAFVSAAPHLANDFTVPDVFCEDLFELLGEETRPDYRWLIMGPARSGSSFHVDPNATSAWNAVISGAKKWILFPPGKPPPGIYPSPDGADVAAPVSIIEWFLNFYDEARQSKHPPIECVVREGEALFVPRGWWHCVLNLTPSVAVTQNYVSSASLAAVLAFLKTGSSELVSGCSVEDRTCLYQRFVRALQQRRPELLEQLSLQQQQKQQQREAEHRLSELFKGQQQQGDMAAAADAAAAVPAASDGGFCFKFGLGESDRDGATAAPVAEAVALKQSQEFVSGFDIDQVVQTCDATCKSGSDNGWNQQQRQQQEQQQQGQHDRPEKRRKR